MKRVVIRKIVKKFKPVNKGPRELPSEQPLQRVPKGVAVRRDPPTTVSGVLMVDDLVLTNWLSNPAILEAAPQLRSLASEFADLPKVCGRCKQKRATYRARIMNKVRKTLGSLSADQHTKIKELVGVKRYTILSSSKGGVMPQDF